jgi:hypothetical protein
MTSLNMSFYDVLKSLDTDDKKATRIEWQNDQYYITFHDEKLMIHKPDNVLYPLTVSRADVLGTDWVLMD